MQNLRVRLFTRKQQNTHQCCGINLPSHRTGTLYHTVSLVWVSVSPVRLPNPRILYYVTLGTYLTF